MKCYGNNTYKHLFSSLLKVPLLQIGTQVVCEASRADEVKSASL